jgi:hypothetical protein
MDRSTTSTNKLQPIARTLSLPQLLVVGSMSLAVPATAGASVYGYRLIAHVSPAEFATTRLCSFALNNLGQVAYMISTAASAAGGPSEVEVRLFDGASTQLVYSALNTEATSPHCSRLTSQPLSEPANVGLRDDGLVSFVLNTPNGRVLAHGRPGVGIQGTIPNPVPGGSYLVGPDINAAGRAAFARFGGGTSVTLGTADSGGALSSSSLSGTISALTGYAAALNGLNQVALFYRDMGATGDPVKLAFHDPNAPAGSQFRSLTLGTLLEVYPRPAQPSMNEKGIVAFTSNEGGSPGSQPARVLAVDLAGTGAVSTVADTSTGRFSYFSGLASINEFDQVAFMSSAGSFIMGNGVHVGTVAGTNPVDVLVRDQVVTMPGLSYTFLGGAALSQQSLNDSGQVLLLSRTAGAAGLNNSEALILATPLARLALSKSLVAGCQSVTGTVTLPAPAPAGGTTVPITETLASATAPASVNVPAGATTTKFVVKTSPLLALESGSVGVVVGGLAVNQPLVVRPMGLSSLVLKPTSVAGSQPSAGTATLECAAGPGPVTVNLSSSRPDLANPVAASIIVPQGLKSASFDVATNAVQAKSYATIAGTANGITKSKKLTVNVAAAVSPTSLRFGSVAVGQTAGPLSTTLTNKGAVPFSVSSISLTGTGASWFAQTNNCPASLVAGASCVISVTFTPAAAASKSAKLTMATSATATPLSVSLSGTGVTPP